MSAVRQMIAVGLVGALVSVAANWLSPSGLNVRRDYFPAAPAMAKKDSQAAAPGSSAAEEDPLSENRADAPPKLEAPSPLAQKVEARGLKLARHADAARLYEDPRRDAGLVVFVDARDRAQYEEGHIPGAYLFDHYRLEEHVGDTLPAVQVADEVVVYCSGGTCEDSLFAAADLVELGVLPEKIWVYEGGIHEWRDQGMPIEEGPRLSGLIHEPHG